jgi:hypothetical protein
VGNWGSDGMSRTLYNRNQLETLEDSLNEFPAKLKQAMFSAASRGTLKRRTWNNCAFNGAGTEIEDYGVRSVDLAAKAFNITPARVTVFIRAWDKLPGTDEYCTQTLRMLIEKVGLFTEPGERQPRIMVRKVYENQQKKLRDQFETIMTANLIPDEDIALSVLVGV